MVRHLLQPGTNTLSIEVSDQVGHTVSTQITVTVETSGDTNAPQALLDLPRDYEITGEQTNFFDRTTYADSKDLYVRGHADADAEWVWLYAENGEGATNSKTSMGRLGAQLLGRVELFPGSNWVCVAAQDAAGNLSTSRYAVIRDTNYVFKITYPEPYAELNGTNIVVKGEISDNLTGAVIAVNGVGIQLGTPTNGGWTFQTTQAVGMAVGLNHLEGVANVNGRSLYLDPPFTEYQMLSFSYKLDYKTYSESSNYRIWQSARNSVDWMGPSATYSQRSVGQSKTCMMMTNYNLSGCYDLPIDSLVNVTLSSQLTWAHFGFTENETASSRTTKQYRDTEVRFVKHAESDEEQWVLLKFDPLMMGNEILNSASAAQVFFRGSPGISIGYNGTVGFVTKIKPNVEQRVTAGDFQWPSHPNQLWKGHLLSIARVSNSVFRVDIVQPTSNSNHVYLGEADYNATGPITFKARVLPLEYNYTSNIVWNFRLEYETDGSGRPLTNNVSSSSGNNQAFNLNYISKGGRLRITASANINGVIHSTTITNFITGVSISNAVITERLNALYTPSTGGTPSLLTGVAMKESTYRQFFNSFTKYNLSARWPIENISSTPPQGSFIGMMQVPVAMDTAWDWLVNTQTGADIFAEKLDATVNEVTNQQAAKPGLRDLTGVELENYALGFYGGFSDRYYTPVQNGGQWEWQTSTRQDLIDYVDVIRNNIQ